MDFSLTELPRDVRSRESTLVLEIKNCRDETLHVWSLTPVLTGHVKIPSEQPLPGEVDERDAASARKRLHQVLVDYVAEQLLCQTTAPVPRPTLPRGTRVREIMITDMAKLVTIPLQFWTVVKREVTHLRRDALRAPALSMFLLQAERLVPQFHGNGEAIDITKDLLTRFPGQGDETPLLRSCEEVLKQLEELDKRLKNRAPVASLAADSVFQRPFVVETRRRNLVRWQRSVVSIEASVSDTQPSPSDQQISASRGQRRTESAYNVIAFSPNPVFVSLYALLGGAIGLVLNWPPGKGPKKSTDSISDWLGWLAKAPGVGVWLPVLALAFILFHIIDLTILGPRFAQHVDWRGALFIGLVCALAGSALLTSIQNSAPDDGADHGSPSVTKTAAPTPSST